MNDVAAWGTLWAEDAVWSLPDFPEVGEVHGRVLIVRAWSGAMAQFPGVIFDSNPGAIEVDGESATARCWTSEVYEQAGSTRRDKGRYDDRLVRQGGPAGCSKAASSGTSTGPKWHR